MKFLSWIWLPPLFMGLLGTALNPHGHSPMIQFVLAGPASIWLMVDIPITIIYVITRIFRRASRDAGPR